MRHTSLWLQTKARYDLVCNGIVGTMAQRYFKGRFDLGKMSMSDLARATAALGVLDEMGKAGIVEFTMGVSRPHRLERVARRIQPQQQRILDLIVDGEWWSAREIADAIAIKGNSVNAQLAVMFENGWIEKGKRPNEDYRKGTRTRKSVYVFRKAAMTVVHGAAEKTDDGDVVHGTEPQHP